MTASSESVLAALRNIVALRLRHEADQFVKPGGGQRPGALLGYTRKHGFVELAFRLSAPPTSQDELLVETGNKSSVSR